MNRIDHFAVAAETLERGQKHLAEKLGVTVPPGGKHDLMGTHNCVTRTGNESFLEILSIDPAAPDPGRARWFSLDEDNTRQRIAARPRALCWVVGTDDLDAVAERSPVDLGEILYFTRGERSWRLTVPSDGHLPEHGLLPAFIEWSPGPHPSTAQQDLGIRLKRIVLSHPQPDRLAEMLDALDVSHLASVIEGQHGLAFEVEGPNGTFTID